MQLKQYQQSTLDKLSGYLKALRVARAKVDKVRAIDASLAKGLDWPREGWRDYTGDRTYTSRNNGLGEPVPAVCLKVPTGGGKTLLAVKAVDLINQSFTGKQHGLVLWIVPTSQIYTQTLKALKDRAHPYRVQLNLASADRVLIKEKGDLFNPQDVQNNLVVVLLMLPSANRQSKETLRIFKDRGGFEAFFPAEDDHDAQRALLATMPNLDRFASTSELQPEVVKTSLGNTLRVLQPVIILDEGHKAYGELAQSTLLGFNPSFILELSATPLPQSNKLVSIGGQELLREGMIKLNINVINKASGDWKDTLRASHLHRVSLERKAIEHEQQTGTYIRPICLVQVERTGKDQRVPPFIHAEDAKDFLLAAGVLPEEIAIKSSERDDIKAEDLLSKDSQVRYIITKSALQEGWDCSFAYILTVLTNPRKAGSSLTQLVGRVLRQPYARKTGHDALDESYVYCFREYAGDLIQRVAAGLQTEGMGDLVGHIVSVDDAGERTDFKIREPFTDWVGAVYLPCFVVKDDAMKTWREVGYEMDVVSRIDWSQISLSLFDALQLNPTETYDSATAIGLSGVLGLKKIEIAPDMPLNTSFVAKQIGDIVANPWDAFDLAEATVAKLLKRYTPDHIKRDMAFVIEELRKALMEQRHTLARAVFDDLIKSKRLMFVLLAGSVGTAVPEKISATPSVPLVDNKGQSPQSSLFEYRAVDFNKTEQDVVLYLDQQSSWVMGWLRNPARTGYGIQGWKPNRVYPDFMVFSQREKFPQSDLNVLRRNFGQVYVLETKGIHLNNEDTQYKQDLFALCNKLCTPKPFDEIAQQLAKHGLYFQVVFDVEWQRVINAMATA
jgi:type III restriction enzyme